MNEQIETFCPECDCEVNANLSERHSVHLVRGENTEFDEVVAICPNCGSHIGDARVEGKNLERAYAVYRSAHGIIAPNEIRALRKLFNLSLREFSKYLGFGEQTVYRYEHGDIPDQSHNNTLVSAGRIEGMRYLLEQNRSKLSVKTIAKIEHRIDELGGTQNLVLNPIVELEDRVADVPNATNGYRRLDFNRVAELVYLLASKCTDLYWTKLQKALFFADMVAFERFSCSLTGLTYAHATHGPVMDRKDDVRYALVQQGVVEFREAGWGEVLAPLSLGNRMLEEDELALIDEVARFVNTFGSASELSEFSHQLDCWKRTSDGEVIDYLLDNGEVGRLMAARLAE